MPTLANLLKLLIRAAFPPQRRASKPSRQPPAPRSTAPGPRVLPLTQSIRADMGFLKPVATRSARASLPSTIDTWMVPVRPEADFDRLDALLGSGQAKYIRCILVNSANQAPPRPSTILGLDIQPIRAALADPARVRGGVRIRSAVGLLHLAPIDIARDPMVAERHVAAWLAIPEPLHLDRHTHELACLLIFTKDNARVL
jgi:hypothetical protein